MSDKWMDMIVLAGQKQELQKVLTSNEKSREFGLTLTEEDAGMLMQSRRDVLKNQRRVEFGEGILPELIQTFCDSQYLNQDNYAETLVQLQDIFYLYKNEAEDNLTDDELLTVMKELFEGICYGSTDYLQETCLERFARAVRAGYRDYEESGGENEGIKFSEEERWDRNLYLMVLYEELS